MKKFLKISVHFAFCGFVGIRGRNISAALAKSPPAALKVLRRNFRNTQQTRRRMTDSKRTARKQPLFKSKILPQYQISLIAQFCPAGILLGLPPQARLFAACAA
ncbi:TPA: hypothetical protein ACSVO6_002370 [Clostridioides difficile]